MQRASGWDLCSVVAAGRNMFCQDLSADYCKPCPPSPFLSDSPWSSSRDCPSDPCEVRPKWDPWEVPCRAGGAGCLLWALFFPHCRNYRPGGPLVWPCDYPGDEQCSQSVAIPLILLMLSFFVSVGPGVGASTSPPGFWDFHNGDLSKDSC